uniref:non-specific serine/threonine protein kinase n=1 Tax=Culicoides sonorensis TaxID=179676 RepID=A0A336MIK8_CULSO
MENYQISVLVGEGSFGKVYKATEKKTKNVVALKILSKRGRNPKDVKQLRRECDIQKDLKHPNIIRMLKSFETENEIVYVTEFAQLDLHTLLSEEGSLGEPKAQKLTFDLVSALYYLHSHRILHRDLKPQNILLDSQSNAKLCDFGLARNMTMSTHVLTSIKGTPLYMSPELLEGKPYDHLADLWSLGCIIYEALAGEPPFYTTSILHLVRLIRHGRIKWPSFLSQECYSFLDSLLVIDPTQRIQWPEILKHPFVDGNILILEDDTPESPFTQAMTDDQRFEKECQAAQLMCADTHLRHQIDVTDLMNAENIQLPEKKVEKDDDVMSSHDSIHAILQSDLENIETDMEEGAVGGFNKKQGKHQNVQAKNPCLVTGNSNLVINNLTDNFPQLSLKTLNDSVNKNMKISSGGSSLNKSNQLERRKLNQNLDNFSVKLESDNKTKDKNDGDRLKRQENLKLEQSTESQSAKINDEIEGTNKITPTLLPGWDSCEDSQNPPIENDEWIVFISKSMQEILDGDLDALKQQNFVSIIVAPLRNSKASPKVIESVAQLFTLPLVLNGPSSLILDIKTIYIEVKLLPNLVYASKLLSQNPPTTNSISPSNNSSHTPTYRDINTLSVDELKTIACIYDLVCHLVHCGPSFLDQFCDAIAILGVDQLLVKILTVHMTKQSKCIKEVERLKRSLLGILGCVLRESPENSELVEKIIFDSKIEDLLKDHNGFVRYRALILLRLLGRFSAVTLEKNWKPTIKCQIEDLLNDEQENIQNEAIAILDEMKHLPFFQQS